MKKRVQKRGRNWMSTKKCSIKERDGEERGRGREQSEKETGRES